MGRLALATALFALLSCAYVLPASWRAFRVEPDDAPPAITQALDDRELEIDTWDQAQARITTDWFIFNDGMSQSKERYVVHWEREERDGTLVVYVRHEAQDREAAVGHDWSGVYHDSAKELALLDAITAAFTQSQAPLPATETPAAAGPDSASE